MTRRHESRRSLRVPRGFAARLAIVALVALVVRLVYVLAVSPSLGLDAIWYVLQSETIADGVGYVDPAPFFERGAVVATANFPPLWPTLLGAANFVGVAETERAYQVIGAVVGSGVVVLTGMLGRRVAGEQVGLVAAALCAACPLLVAADGSLMADSLFVALVLVALLLAYRAARGGGPGVWAALGFVLGLAALAHSEGLVLAPVLVVPLAWRLRSRAAARRAALAALALAVTAATLVPWAVRNSLALDDVTLLSNNSGSLLEGANCSRTYGGEHLGSWDPRCLRFTRAPGLTEAESAARARDAGLRYARAHPGRLPLVGSVRVLRSWGFYDPIDQARSEAVETRHADWQVLGWAFSVAMVPLAVAGAVLLGRRGTDIVPLLAVVVGITLVVIASWGNQRFHLAADPVVLVLAAAALVIAWQRAGGIRSGP